MSYYDTLIKKYEKILEEEPDSIKAVLSLARLYFKTKNIEKSMPFYESLIDPMPNNFEIFKSMGVMYLARNNKYRAMEYIKKALLLKENDPCLYEYAAEIDEVKSDECYDIAVKLYKEENISEALSIHCFMMAIKLYKKCKYDLSLEYLHLTYDYMENTVEFKNLLGSLLYSTKKYDEAIKEYNKAIELAGYNDYLILINISSCYRKKKEFENALKYLIEALNSTESKQSVYYNIALVYLDMEDKDNAIKNLNYALEIDSHYQQAKKLYLELTN